MLELIKGLAMLLAIALLHRYVLQLTRNNDTHRQILCGLLFGGMCVFVMSTPLELAPGIIFDPRSVVLSMAGLFSGVIGSVIAGGIAGGYRAWLGGGGAPVGVSVVVMCTVAGLAFRELYNRKMVSLNWVNLLMFGGLVHLLTIGLFTMLPAEVVAHVMNSVAIPMVIVFTPGVMILGFLLADNEKTAEIQGKLELQTREAREANAAKSRFIATMSHELRTPLNAILGFTEIIHNETMGPLGNKKYAEYIEDIRNSGQDLRRMIDDLLDITRLDLRTYEFFNEEINVAAITKDLTHRFEVLAEKSGIEIRFSAADDFPPVLFADRKVLTHIFNNLISNAIKACSPGDEIEVSVRVIGDEYVLQVQDTGAGMSREMQSKLGTPFVRHSDADLARNSNEGIGIGFYVTRSLVEARGGRVEVESELGKGTTVRAIYPKSLFAPRDPRPQSSTEDIDHTPERENIP
ncbi:MAG: sensor histidine kinase [Rhodospirillales bacterium]